MTFITGASEAWSLGPLLNVPLLNYTRMFVPGRTTTECSTTELHMDVCARKDMKRGKLLRDFSGSLVVQLNSQLFVLNDTFWYGVMLR